MTTTSIFQGPISESGVPHDSDTYMPTNPTGPSIWSAGFSRVIASGVDTNLFSVVQTGSGQTISQSAGNLVIASGTTVNSETILRSTQTFHGALNLLAFVQLSQRIVNQNFYIELVDVVGDALAFTMNSATSISVTIPSNPLTSANVGQSIFLGAISGIAVGIPGRYAIASVSGNVVTFTVAGFTASGSGTLSLFGLNYNHLVYTSTTATNVNWDTQRSGWNNGDVAIAINTTASPGHIAAVSQYAGRAYLADQVTTSATALELTERASRLKNVQADDGTNYVLQIRVANGSTAPASTTSLTIAQIQVENFTYQNMVLSGVSSFGKASGLPVEIINPTTLTVTGTVTANSGNPTTTGTTTAVASTGTAVQSANVKNAAGTLYAFTATNPTATPMWVHFYNVASAPTMGTTASLLSLPVPANSTTSLEWGAIGMRFATGISYAITGAAGSLDTTVIVAGLMTAFTWI